MLLSLRIISLFIRCHPRPSDAAIDAAGWSHSPAPVSCCSAHSDRRSRARSCSSTDASSSTRRSAAPATITANRDDPGVHGGSRENSRGAWGLQGGLQGCMGAPGGTPGVHRGSDLWAHVVLPWVRRAHEGLCLRGAEGVLGVLWWMQMPQA